MNSLISFLRNFLLQFMQLVRYEIMYTFAVTYIVHCYWNNIFLLSANKFENFQIYSTCMEFTTEYVLHKIVIYYENSQKYVYIT